jgi:flagellar biosynthesis/type III secretory pathway protein FliH
MAWTPHLNVTCGRCGKPRGLTHVCVSNSRRKATVKPQFTFGTCPVCRKPQGNPLTHTCRPRSDFRRRRARHEKQAKAARKKRQADRHDYQSCRDGDCPRPLCVAFKTGYRQGDQDGYERGYEAGNAAGYQAGFQAGMAACPLSHSG